MKTFLPITSVILLAICGTLTYIAINMYIDHKSFENEMHKQTSEYLDYRFFTETYMVGRNIDEVKAELREKYPKFVERGDNGKNWYLKNLFMVYDENKIITSIEPIESLEGL
ncbi:MAG: hypothetical protein ACI9D5_000817 [Candidatus Endobugula sp.]|jgi:hypothetical protein